MLVAKKRACLSDTLPSEEWQLLTTKPHADSASYVLVSLHEENPQEVYFDAVSVRIVREREIQEHNYDP